MATHCSILAWKTPWTEKPEGPHTHSGLRQLASLTMTLNGTSHPGRSWGYFSLRARQRAPPTLHQPNQRTIGLFLDNLRQEMPSAHGKPTAWRDFMNWLEKSETQINESFKIEVLYHCGSSSLGVVIQKRGKEKTVRAIMYRNCRMFRSRYQFSGYSISWT